MADQVRPVRQRMLFIAKEACGNPALCAEVRAHAADAADVLVVAPVLGSSGSRWISDEAADRALAEEALDRSVTCLRKHGLRAHGVLGDSDPVQSIEDALYRFPAEEIVICVEDPEQPHWLHGGVVERAKRRFAIPVTEIRVASKQAARVA